MKTAQEWIPILNDNGQSWTATVKAIQSDAMREAAEIVDRQLVPTKITQPIRNAILARIRELEENK